MFGPKDLGPDMRGVIPRAADALFSGIAESEELDEVTIKCSFLGEYEHAVAGKHPQTLSV
jgi:hypothetical protein